MNAARQAGQPDLVVQSGRRGHADRINLVQQRAIVGVGRHLVAIGDVLRPAGVIIGDADQLAAGQRGIDAGVVLADIADADHTGANLVVQTR